MYKFRLMNEYEFMEIFGCLEVFIKSFIKVKTLCNKVDITYSLFLEAIYM